ncbi:MAG: YggS family pyridoxal phosphate-dependent enzyme [Clostridia bacterium]|nr:YggS family pyridoxal phosphate-dependent enzyme [Clostridia bacterium]
MIKENLLKVLEEIKNGNNLAEPITLVGATKMVSVDEINFAISNGLKVVAENRVQEFREKTAFINGASQHFIGHLQTNKVKYLVGKVDLIHSVDSIRLGQEISKECLKKEVYQDILVEINIGGELSKSGFSLENAKDGVMELTKLPNIKVVGLMAMLPKTEDTALLKNLCLQMRELYDKLKSDGLPFTYLSVGMSADYKIAIENGSNTIRLGTTIFGKRNYEVKN